jgi:uncharacterized membrane protein
MEGNTNKKRSMEDGGWYWINKSIILVYAKDIGMVGLAVYNCLASFVGANQKCYPTQEQIGKILGLSRVTVNKAIRKLVDKGLISVDKTSRGNCIYRLLAVGCKSQAGQVLSSGTSDVKLGHTNNNKLTKINNNIVNVKDSNRDVDICCGLNPAVQNESLALELAQSLNDQPNLHIYISYCRNYSESLLRGVIREVMAVPASKIRKSRAALFKYLVKTYEKEKKDNSSH